MKTMRVTTRPSHCPLCNRLVLYVNEDANSIEYVHERRWQWGAWHVIDVCFGLKPIKEVNHAKADS